MAKAAKQAAPKKSQRTKPIPVEELMFAFRTINSHGGTKEFLAKCAEHGYSVRITSKFFDFVHQEAMDAAAKTLPATIASASFDAAMKAKDWNDCTKKKKGFFS